MQRTIVVRIDKVVAEGDGLGRDDDGKVVFVQGALPGELVSARVVADSKDYARAEVVDVLEPNPHRIDPPCPFVAAGCGGCDLQHADDTVQLEMKREIVVESLERLGRIEHPDVRSGPRARSESRLRTTVRVAARGNGVGFRRRRSHDVVGIDSCLVAHPRLNEIIARLRLAPGSEAVIRVSASSGEGVVWSEPEEAVVECPVDVRTGAHARIHETIAGVNFVVSAGSFFQSSPAAAEALVDAAARALGPVDSWPTGPVIDAYGGVGLFSAALVPTERPVVLIETNPSSCADARINLADHDVEVIEGRVEDWKSRDAAIVIADPARDGLRADAVDVLTACNPEILLLVSCDPASLGRDAKLLVSRGYRLDYSEVLDAFPHTHHVETVSRFVRSEHPVDS